MSERYLLKSRQPDADFEHRLVSADGEFEFYFRCSESAARELVEHLDSLHERIAAALNAQAVERNRADLLAEDIEAFHLALDKHGVPRADEAGAVFSMYGRALRLDAQAGVVEALREARETVYCWGQYASPYFQEKHDLAGDLAKIDAALAAVNGVKP